MRCRYSTKAILLCFFVFAIVFSMGTDSADAKIISINADEGSSRATMAASDLAGAPGARVANWNNFLSGNRTLPANVTSPVAGTLIYSDGSTVGGAFTVTTVGATGYNTDDGSTNDPRMYRGSFAINANGVGSHASMTVTLNNIPFAHYDLYVYAQGQNVSGSNFRGGSVQISDGTIFWTQGGSIPDNTGAGYVAMTTTSIPVTPIESDIAFGNYALFSGLTSGSQTITLDSYGWTDYARMQLYGLQIVETQTPEPTSIALLTIGSLLIVRRRAKA